MHPNVADNHLVDGMDCFWVGLPRNLKCGEIKLKMLSLSQKSNGFTRGIISVSNSRFKADIPSNQTYLCLDNLAYQTNRLFVNSLAQAYQNDHPFHTYLEEGPHNVRPRIHNHLNHDARHPLLFLAVVL